MMEERSVMTSSCQAAVDEDLATLTASRLAIEVSQPLQGVPGFPDFPDCWTGEEGALRKQKEDEERELQFILAEAKALKEAAQSVRHRRPFALQRKAVNKFGLSQNNKTKVHRRITKIRRSRMEMEKLRKSMKGMRITIKYKME
jgi:hypothetical protein